MGSATWLLGAGLCLCLLGCQSSTGVVIDLRTDLSSPDELDSVSLTLSSEGISQFSNRERPWPVGPGKRYRLPGSFAVYADRPIKLDATVEGWLGAEPIVERKASLTLERGRVLKLNLALVRACTVGAAGGLSPGDRCRAGQTCIEGSCLVVEVNGSRLPDYHPGDEDRIECASGSQFIDTSTQRVLDV